MKRKYTIQELKIIRKVKEEQNRCCYCGKKLKMNERTIDHIVPMAIGGQTIEKNLAVACLDCNEEKGDMTLGEYGDFVNKKKDLSEKYDDEINELINQKNKLNEELKFCEINKHNYNLLINYCTKMLSKIKKIRYNITALKKEIENIKERKSIELYLLRCNYVENDSVASAISAISNSVISNSVISNSVISNSVINNSVINNSVINKVENLKEMDVSELEEWVEEGYAGFMVSKDSLEEGYVESEELFNVIPRQDIKEVKYLDNYKQDIIVNLLNGATYNVSML